MSTDVRLPSRPIVSIPGRFARHRAQLDSPTVEISTQSADGCQRLTVSGELDLATSTHLSEAGLRALESPGLVELQLDLSQVSFIDSTGIGALVQLKNATDENGRRLVLLDPAPRVAEVLELTGMIEVFEVEISPGSAEPRSSVQGQA